jgi:hypothetical protein
MNKNHMIRSLFPGKLSVAFLILITASSLVLVASGQTARVNAQKFQRPEDCGLHDYDEFKNSSFNLLGEALKADLNYQKLKAGIQDNFSGEKEFNDSLSNSNLDQLRAMLRSARLMNDRIKILIPDGNELFENVSRIKPETTAKQATSNTKNSMKAVHISGDLLSELTDNLTKDIEALSRRIARKGGTMREVEDKEAMELE